VIVTTKGRQTRRSQTKEKQSTQNFRQEGGKVKEPQSASSRCKMAPIAKNGKSMFTGARSNNRIEVRNEDHLFPSTRVKQTRKRKEDEGRKTEDTDRGQGDEAEIGKDGGGDEGSVSGGNHQAIRQHPVAEKTNMDRGTSIPRSLGALRI